MPELPSGTVTFLFTDIEGSTRLLQALGDAYAKVWLGPPVALAESHDCSPRDLRTVLEIVTAQRAMMEQNWHEHFGT